MQISRLQSTVGRSMEVKCRNRFVYRTCPHNSWGWRNNPNIFIKLPFLTTEGVNKTLTAILLSITEKWLHFLCDYMWNAWQSLMRTAVIQWAHPADGYAQQPLMSVLLTGSVLDSLGIGFLMWCAHHAMGRKVGLLPCSSHRSGARRRAGCQLESTNKADKTQGEYVAILDIWPENHSNVV